MPSIKLMASIKLMFSATKLILMPPCKIENKTKSIDNQTLHSTLANSETFIRLVHLQET